MFSSGGYMFIDEANGSSGCIVLYTRTDDRIRWTLYRKDGELIVELY
jgi:hypothetical protein